MEEKALGLAVVEAVSEMKRIGGSRHKRVSCTLVILNLLQALSPAAIGLSSLNAAELPELGITEKSSKEQSIFSRDFDSFIAGEAIRLASPFSSGLTEQTVLDKMKDSTYRHESNEMDTRFSFDSEKEYWINSAKSQAESYLNDRLESGASKVVGTVRSELKFDEHMKLSGYAFDVLSPFYENDYNTFFFAAWGEKQ